MTELPQCPCLVRHTLKNSFPHFTHPQSFISSPYGTDWVLTTAPLSHPESRLQKSASLSRFPEATQQDGKALIQQQIPSLRTTEVGCKSPWGQRSSVFIISVAIILRVIISCKISSLRQEMGVDISEEVKRCGSCIACCPAAVVWVSFPPQDLTQASTCPSSKSSPSRTVKEAAAFHPRNHRWQDWVTISGSNAQLPCPLTTAAPIFDKLRSWVLFIISQTFFPEKSLPFLYHILREEPEHISLIVIQSKCSTLVLIESSKAGTPPISDGACSFIFISWHLSITAVWKCLLLRIEGSHISID